MVPFVRRPVLVGLVLVVAMVGTLTILLGVQATGSDRGPCQRFAADSRDRAAAVSGSGAPVLVIGDSWSAGLGLDRTSSSWPSRLSGTVRVAGFSGSGFSGQASPCARVSFAERAPRALRAGADLVVVQGGLNDYDQPAADVRAGFASLLRELRGHRVVVVGPASAPSRATGAGRVDAQLARLTDRYDVDYIRTSALDLTYLPDRLHLTPAGHRAFGDYVANAIAELDS